MTGWGEEEERELCVCGSDSSLDCTRVCTYSVRAHIHNFKRGHNERLEIRGISSDITYMYSGVCTYDMYKLQYKLPSSVHLRYDIIHEQHGTSVDIG